MLTAFGEINTVVFDAVGTLIRPEPAAADIYAQVGRRHGSQLTAPEVAQRFKSAFLHEESLDRGRYGFRTSEARERERWQRIVRDVLADASDHEACFEELYRHFARPDAWRLLPDAADTVAWLGQRGWALAVASNYDHRLRSVLEGMPALRELQRVVISAEVGWRKPAPEFFSALCRHLGLRPAQVLLVGDDFDNDYGGARGVGMQAVLLDPSRQRLDVARIDRLGDLARLLG